MAKREIDIHSYDKAYVGILDRLKRSEISDNNKNLIKKFDDHCVLEKLSIPRRLKIIHTLTLVAETLKKEEISERWGLLLKETGINPIDMHPPLWFWSRKGFVYDLKNSTIEIKTNI